jgi:tetratricopeptide (TPR) repeat protein
MFLEVVLRNRSAVSLPEALALVDKAAELAPPDSNILDTRGQIRLALGHVDAALADLEKSIALGADLVGTWYARGRAFELKGNRGGAIADYQKALSLKTNDTEWITHARLQARARLKVLGVELEATDASPR